MLPTKPISEKQLAANRRNARKSTGPVTEAGRQTVSLNAVKHGLRGQTAVLPDEDRAAHQAFCGGIVDEFAPATPMELNLAQSIANDLWRLNRARAIECNMIAVGQLEDDPDPDHDPAMQIALAGARTFMNHAGKFGLLSLYEQRIHRAVHKNRAELRQMQAERRQVSHRDQQATAAPGPIPVAEFETKTAPNGFDRANEVFRRPFGGLSLVSRTPVSLTPVSRTLAKAA
jgi:hypothetical protein